MLFEKAVKAGALTQSDLAVVSFISQNPQTVTHMTSRQLAEATYVSPSTVVRLCKKAGFASFGDMKMALAREQERADSYERMDADFPQLTNASTAQVIARVSSMERQAIRQTEQLLAQVRWDPILDALDGATGITLYAMGFSLTPCEGFVRDMARLGYRTCVISEESDARQWAAACPRDEFSILISYSGQTLLTNDAALILSSRGLPSLSITAEGENALAHNSSWHVPVALMHRRFANDRVSHVQQSTELAYALNVLYALHFSRHYAESVRSIQAMLDRQGVAIHREQDVEHPTIEMSHPYGAYAPNRLGGA